MIMIVVAIMVMMLVVAGCIFTVPGTVSVPVMMIVMEAASGEQAECDQCGK